MEMLAEFFPPSLGGSWTAAGGSRLLSLFRSDVNGRPFKVRVGTQTGICMNDVGHVQLFIRSHEFVLVTQHRKDQFRCRKLGFDIDSRQSSHTDKKRQLIGQMCSQSLIMRPLSSKVRQPLSEDGRVEKSAEYLVHIFSRQKNLR